MATALVHNYYAEPTEPVSVENYGTIHPVEAIKEGFNAQFKAGNVLQWLVFGFLALLISGGVSVAASMANAPELNTGQFPETTVVGALISLVAVAISFYFSLGITQGYLRGLRERNPKISDLFVTNGKIVGRGIGAILLILAISTVVSLVVGFASATVMLSTSGTLATVLGVVAGVIVAILVLYISITVSFVLFAVIDSGTGIIDAYKVSFGIAHSNFWRILALVIMAGVLYIVPGAVFIVSIALTSSIAVGVVVAVLMFTCYVLIYGPIQAAHAYAYNEATYGKAIDNGTEVPSTSSAAAYEAGAYDDQAHAVHNEDIDDQIR